MRQGDLFGDDGAAPVQPAYVPKPEHILNRLVEMLAAMRAAEVWPWDEVQTDLYREHVWPHLLRHLPPAEAEAWSRDLMAEAERLDRA